MNMKKNHRNLLTRDKRNILTLFFLPIILTIIGIFFVYEASTIDTMRRFGDGLYYFRQQSVWFVFAIAVMIFFANFDYHKLYYLSFPALVFTLASLVLVLVPGLGVTVNGARRWLGIGTMVFQPSEVAKFSIILYLCSWFLLKERQRFFSYLVLMSIIIFLIMMQPDMGTAMIILGIFLLVYVIAGLDFMKLVMLSPFAAGILFVFVQSSPYRLKRILAFMNPEFDSLGISYHVNQILISLSAGGIFGRGYGESRQKFQFLPEAHTDSIFAIIGEELGFIGGFALIMGLLYLIYQAYLVARNAKDRYGQLLAGGIFSLIALQTAINLSAMVGLLPLTGVPLPFISYGGSNLLIFFALMGILINIQKQSK